MSEAMPAKTLVIQAENRAFTYKTLEKLCLVSLESF